MDGDHRDWMGTILTRKPLFCKRFGACWERLGWFAGGEGGILCQGPKDLENCSKISVSGQPRWVVCTGSMYRTKPFGSS